MYNKIRMAIMLLGFTLVTLIGLSYSGNVSGACGSEWELINRNRAAVKTEYKSGKHVSHPMRTTGMAVDENTVNERPVDQSSVEHNSVEHNSVDQGLLNENLVTESLTNESVGNDNATVTEFPKASVRKQLLDFDLIFPNFLMAL